MSLTLTQFLSWSLVTVIIWVQSFSGTNSTFPGYSSQLKQLLSLSQRHLNYFAFASDAGKLLGFISGLAASHFPGLDWLVLLIGSILGLIGYGLQYLAIKFHITFLLSFWSFLVLSFIAGHSICWMNTVCLVFIQKFKSNHQVAAGIITSYQGLSTKIYTDIVHVVSSAPGTAFVPLSSSFGFFGRLIPSFIDYYIRHKISRPALVAILMVPEAAAFILLLSNANTSLFISTAIIGTCTGAISSIAISITAELFGTVNFPVNHNIMVANIPLGSLVFGQLASHVYHKEGVLSGDGKCIGMECYRSTFILWGSLCCLGFFIALVLYARTRKFYSQ